jgi:mono/diheme cytochrome c family protein
MENVMLAKTLVYVCLGSIVSMPALAQADGDLGRGMAFAQATCAACHGVLSTDRSSPRPDTVTFKVIANSPGMTGIAINVWLLTPHRSMPNFIIEPQDRADVIAYIVSLKDTP